MKYIFISTLILSVISIGVYRAVAVEEARYKLLKKIKKIEIRQYDPCLLAEVTVDSNLEDAGNLAFRMLFNYITGKNRSQQKIAMTAPVSQIPAGEKIAMTAPVSQQKSGDQWAVSFMMPAGYTMENIPQPDDSRVTIRQIPARNMAAIRYSGSWNKDNYEKYKSLLETTLQENKIIPTGPAIWARYNPPFTPGFLRRNEVLIPISISIE